MLTDLFSQFDPSVSILFKYSTFFFWGLGFVNIFIFSFFCVCLCPSGLSSLIRRRLVSMDKVCVEMGIGPMSGLFNLLGAVFYMVMVINLIGLLPGTFSISSHFLFSISLAIPLWLSLMMMTFSGAPVTKVGSYIGTGIPVALGPFIGACEIISTLMRPLSLGLRLAANMLAGHVIVSLVANCLVYLITIGGAGAIIFSVVSFGLFLFEGAVCLIQAYVFILLLRVYAMEFPT